MDTFARLRRLRAEGMPSWSNDPMVNQRMLRDIWRERIDIAYGRAIWARVALVGWLVAAISLALHGI